MYVLSVHVLVMYLLNTMFGSDWQPPVRWQDSFFEFYTCRSIRRVCFYIDASIMHLSFTRAKDTSSSEEIRVSFRQTNNLKGLPQL